MATAILVDGAFFLRRFRYCFPDHDRNDPKSVAEGLGMLAYWHLSHRIGPHQLLEQIARYNLQLSESREFYRIFFYDCSPLTKRMHWPLTRRSIDFGKSTEATFRLRLHEEIRKLRKVAVRLGKLNDTSRWRLSERATMRLIQSPSEFVASDDDFEVDTKQKGVDMRLGLDVASLAFKRQVDQIVIVAADADFVPAAKLARREGIDVLLDRMGDKRAAPDLIEHVDGVRDCFLPRPKDKQP
ncbi:NYN domain-containing protein [Sphingomonas canadensis]|uniref:NYN domain-containing protein n=1 Tax=Sphingomonas canadensis TaxID=1219257 RepID=A0ABW3H0C6_9SPHN|nr:NYN domain-containing protein [Sphingomonas canadensis]MCW3835237.1 NYN domain-containing protein [Sphingomonas canadensis]